MTAAYAADALAAAVKAVRPAIGRTSYPALSNVKIEDGTVTASDLDVTAVATVAVSATLDAGVVTLADPALLTSALRGSKAQATIETNGGETTLRVGRRIVTWSPPPLDDWPKLQMLDGGDTAEFGDAIAHVAYAASDDQNRAALTVVACGDGHAVATDSYRLSVAVVPAFDGPNRLVPARAAALAAKHGCTAGVFGERTARFDADGLSIVARLIDADYPRWQQLVGKPDVDPIIVDRDIFRDAVGAATWGDTVRLHVRPGEIELAVHGAGRTQTETIDAKTDRTVDIAFAATFLDDALAACGDEVTILITDELKPAHFSTAGIDDRYEVLMPVRVA